MADTRIARFRNGPKDGESMVWSGGHAIQIKEKPPVYMLEGRPIPRDLMDKTGFYIESLPGEFYWNGWHNG